MMLWVLWVPKLIETKLRELFGKRKHLFEKAEKVLESFSEQVKNSAREAGFEPANAGTKNQCLTTWRLPSGIFERKSV